MPESNGAAAVHDPGRDHRLPAVRPATQRDIVAFYGALPKESMQAFAVVLDDEVVGIIGLAHGWEVSRFFSDARPVLKPYMRTMPILRAIKRVMRLVKSHKGPVYAVPDHDEGRRVLVRLGFTDYGEIFTWES